MSSPEAVYEELEADHRSREGEVRLVERLLKQDGLKEEEKAMLKRSLILLAYAHLEGFCKFALSAYASSLNALKLPCAEATYPVVAASLAKVFAALRNPSSKHSAFKRVLPDDAQLHLAAREQIFIESYELIAGQHVKIPDEVIDTKSNLSSHILKKLLFQVGLNYSSIDAHQAKLNKLLGLRNAIAHGDRLMVPKDEQVAEYSAMALETMRFLKNEIYGALKGKLYLRSTRIQTAAMTPEEAIAQEDISAAEASPS